MGTDGGLWQLLSSHITGAQVHWQRIELGAVGSGVPDLNYCIDGVEGWAELKATDTYTIPFKRPYQPSWIDRRTRAGGRVVVVTRRTHQGGPRRGPPCDEIWIHTGRDVLAIDSGGLLAAPTLLHQEGGPRHWDWEAVRSALTLGTR